MGDRKKNASSHRSINWPQPPLSIRQSQQITRHKSAARDPCISEIERENELGRGRGRPGDPGPVKAASKQGTPRPSTRSKARTVAGAAQARARIKRQGGVRAPSRAGSTAMGEVNAAIDVGKRQLEVALGSAGERFAENNEPRAIARLCQRLAAAGCARVLIEGGSYQNLLVGALRAAGLPVVI